MKKIDTSNWTIKEGKQGLMLFAQAFEEMMSIESHDSYKVPVLNFHYICYEILQVIELIENDILDKGNLVPLLVEAKSLFQQDKIVQEILGNDFDAIFFKKNSKGEFDQKHLAIDSEKAEINHSVVKKGLSYIVDELKRNNQYYKSLINHIKEEVSKKEIKLCELNELYDVIKIAASELINRGFSQNYIYDCIVNLFFDKEKAIDSIDIIDEFFFCFENREKKYSVYLPIKSIKQKKELEEFKTFEFAENVYEMFTPEVQYILKFKCEANDPYIARKMAVDMINFCLSVNHFTKHSKYDYDPKFAEVVDLEDKNTIFIKKPLSSIRMGFLNSEYLNSKSLIKNSLSLGPNIFQVLQLHSSALMSDDTENQFINLWTAVEVAIPVARKDGLCRVNQISNTLTAVLGTKYFLDLIAQLCADIKIVSEEVFSKIEKQEFSGNIKEKMLAVCLLSDFSNTYSEIIDIFLEISPLLACRIYRIHSNWNYTDSIKTVYKKHSQRLSQQIMRIYRTRNMIVHDGSTMPYMEYILQNLHYYVDSYVEVINAFCNLGYTSIQTIVDAILFQEQTYFINLSKNDIINEVLLRKLLVRIDINETNK